jgi:uncharacterized protein YndB with AHSA1/START domain
MSEERVAIERTIFVAAPPQTVFGFLTDPVLMAQWIGLFHTLDPKPGGVFRVELSPGNIAIGVFTEVIAHRRVAFTWGWESADNALAALKPGASLVEFDLEPQNGGTLVRIRHTGLPENLERAHAERWSNYLDRLEKAARPDKVSSQDHQQ